MMKPDYLLLFVIIILLTPPITISTEICDRSDHFLNLNVTFILHIMIIYDYIV